MPISEATNLLAGHHMSLIYQGTLFLSHILERLIKFTFFPIASNLLKQNLIHPGSYYPLTLITQMDSFIKFFISLC